MDIIGIDLGTTNSVVAHMTDEGPQLIPNSLGDRLTPSVVGIDPDGRLLVGRAARELRVTQPDRCASIFKRYMGSDWTTNIGGRSFTPEQLSSLVLKSLKEDAEAYLGCEIHHAVITVPAYFNEHQRKATINAGKIAGLHVQRILNEPTAAAIAYGLRDSTTEQSLVVLDLGGGTFDVSVVELFEGVVEIRASAGETWLGGEDFTRAIAARIIQEMGDTFERAEFSSPLMVSRLIQQCEQAKLKLSSDEETAIRIPTKEGALHDKSPVARVNREHFQTWTRAILGRIDMPIRRALADSRIPLDKVTGVILVGGATRMPMFVEHVTKLFAKAPQCHLNPDEVVALGAAVQAGLIARNECLDELVVTDVAPFTLGLETSRQVGHERRTGYFAPIINRSTTIPASRVERFSTVEPNQTVIRVKIYQGESRLVKDNLLLGEFEVRKIPLGPAGQEVDVRFTYDLNGVLEVEATVVKTGETFTHIVTRHARGMSAADIAAAVKRMQELKSHPREEAVNQFLIRRAERIYQELSLVERQQLDMLLHGFEVSLEAGDLQVISEHRDALQVFLERFDPTDSDDAPWSDER